MCVSTHNGLPILPLLLIFFPGQDFSFFVSVFIGFLWEMDLAFPLPPQTGLFSFFQPACLPTGTRVFLRPVSPSYLLRFF